MNLKQKVMHVILEHYEIGIGEIFNIDEHDSCIKYKFDEDGCLLENDVSVNMHFECVDSEYCFELIDELITPC